MLLVSKLRPSQLHTGLSAKLRDLFRLLKMALKQFRLRFLVTFLLAALPYTLFLLIFKFYIPLRRITHLETLSPPTFTVLPAIEERLFFFQPHKLLSQLANPVFDVLAAIPYLIHFPLPFIFGGYLAIHPTKRGGLLSYMWCAGWVNLLAVVTQLTFPTASPWFVDSAILDEHGHVIYEHPNEAGFKRLDGNLGFAIFHNIYSQSPLKFGAFPSLHVAWPMIVFLNHPWFGPKTAGVHVLWITLAAVYSTHHYLVDCLAGILLATVVRLCILKLWSPFPELSEWKNGGNSSSSCNGASRTATGVIAM